MKRTAVEGIVVAIFVLAIVQIGASCATKGILGDGKLEPMAKTAVGIGAAAASAVAPEYAGVIAAAKDKLVNMGGEEAAEAMLTDAEFFAAAKRLGFGVSLVYRVAGVIVAGESVSWTWNIIRAHTGADAVPPSADEVADAVDGTGAEPVSDLDAEADALFDRIEVKKKVK